MGSLNAFLEETGLSKEKASKVYFMLTEVSKNSDLLKSVRNKITILETYHNEIDFFTVSRYEKDKSGKKYVKFSIIRKKWYSTNSNKNY